jgi:hypothetical protein
MTRPGLLLATLFTVLLTLLALTWAGWFQPRAGSLALPRIVHPHPSKAQEQLTSEEGVRWRACQAHHWRDLLLQQH